MKQKTCKKITSMGDGAIACITAVVIAAKDVRKDIMDPKKLDEPLKFFERYKFYFLHHKRKHNDNKLQTRICGDTEEKQEYNPFREIAAKGLEDIVYSCSGNDVIDVRYFETTEHQARKPMRCYFHNGDYMIDFGQRGTEWCGGMRGNGYVFKRGETGTYQQIAIISPELSDYLAQIADEKMQSQVQGNQISRGSR